MQMLSSMGVNLTLYSTNLHVSVCLCMQELRIEKNFMNLIERMHFDAKRESKVDKSNEKNELNEERIRKKGNLKKESLAFGIDIDQADTQSSSLMYNCIYVIE